VNRAKSSDQPQATTAKRFIDADAIDDEQIQPKARPAMPIQRFRPFEVV
jgi:hypothetical protein